MGMRVSRVTFFCVTVVMLFLLSLPSLYARTIRLRPLTIINSDAMGAPIKLPEGVACGGKSYVIVADTGNGRLLKYNLEDGIPEKDPLEIKVPQLVYPAKTMVDSKNRIYTMDKKKRRIIRLTDQGMFETFLEPKDVPPPASSVLRSFALDASDNILLLDILSARVLTLNSEGNFLKEVKFPESYGFFSDIAVDGKGRALILDSVEARIYVKDKDAERFVPLTGRLKEYMRFPVHLCTDAGGKIFLADRNGGSIIILAPDGSFIGRQSGMGWNPGLLRYPSQIHIDSMGRVFVADSMNNRIQIFSISE